MSDLREITDDAVHALCVKFEQGGYHPTPVIDLGVLVARADGTVDEKERQMLSEVFAALLGQRVPPEVVGHLIEASLEVIEQAGVDARAALISEILLDCHAVEEGLTVAVAIALASEGLSKDERAILEKIAAAARFPGERLEALIAKVRAKMPSGESAPESARDSLSSPVSKRSMD